MDDAAFSASSLNLTQVIILSGNLVLDLMVFLTAWIALKHSFDLLKVDSLFSNIRVRPYTLLSS